MIVIGKDFLESNMPTCWDLNLLLYIQVLLLSINDIYDESQQTNSTCDLQHATWKFSLKLTSKVLSLMFRILFGNTKIYVELDLLRTHWFKIFSSHFNIQDCTTSSLSQMTDILKYKRANYKSINTISFSWKVKLVFSDLEIWEILC